MTARSDAVAVLLEVVASDHPGLLGSVVSILASSSAAPSLLEFAASLGADDLLTFGATLRVLVTQLDTLEDGGYGRWRHPREVLGETANAQALLMFARAREERTHGTARRRRLARLRNALREAARSERASRLIEKYAGLRRRSAAAADPVAAMVKDFIGKSS